MGKDKELSVREDVFYDCHLHLMNFDYINFTPLLYYFLGNVGSSITSGFLSSSYINPQNGKITKNLANTLTRFQEPIKDTILSLEEDLKGHLGHQNAFIKEDGRFHFRNESYSKYALCPLCMDFSSEENDKPYYKMPYRDKITPFAEDTLFHIKAFKDEHKDSILTFYPFLGINPCVHSKGKIQSLLDRFFKQNEDERFSGVKFYPPLGTDPWPIHNRDEWEKVELIYSFLEENNIPLTTHCDNQGFRVIDTKLAWKYTDPESWKYVLEAHPKLKVNFAHFGRCYTNTTKVLDKVLTTVLSQSTISHDTWMKTIIDYIIKYDNVYTDLSFSLTDNSFVKALETMLLTKNEATEKLKSRILFGSDFSINLLKIDSYNTYLKNFESSNFEDDVIKRTTTTNVRRFLFE